MGQPTGDQGDVRPGDGLPLSVDGRRRRRRRAAGRRSLTLAAAAAVLVAAPPAHAAGEIDRAAASLRTDPVYVDPGAELHVDAARVRREIESAGAGPMYVAVLPDAAAAEAGGDPDGVIAAIHDRLGREGTYAVIVGKHFRAGSQGILRRGVAGDLATQALDARRAQGPTAVLVDFADRVGRAKHNGGTAPSHRTGGGGTSLFVLIALAAGGFGLWHLIRNRRRDRAQLAEVKAAAHDDLIALAEDVQGLEGDVDSSGNRDAQEAYRHALDAYDKANHAYDRARRPQEIERVTELLGTGRYEMAVADALAHGRAAPERRPPCFFDPSHGPSTRDVEWTPPGGAPRTVPACEADAQRVERGIEPESRRVLVGGQAVPYWGAPPYFGGWAGGYFSPFGGTGFISGLFMGELLGGAFGGFGYGPLGYGGFGSWGGGGYGGDFGGGGDGGGWSDFGGGGGMDFGGGDFGGGGGDF